MTTDDHTGQQAGTTDEPTDLPPRARGRPVEKAARKRRAESRTLSAWVREEAGRWHFTATVARPSQNGGVAGVAVCGASYRDAEARDERPDPDDGLAVCPDCATIVDRIKEDTQP